MRAELVYSYYVGPFYTPVLSGAASRNTELRKALGMSVYKHTSTTYTLSIIPIPNLKMNYNTVPIAPFKFHALSFLEILIFFYFNFLEVGSLL